MSKHPHEVCLFRHEPKKENPRVGTTSSRKEAIKPKLEEGGMQTALGEGKGVLSSDTQALGDTARAFLTDGAGD